MKEPVARPVRRKRFKSMDEVEWEIVKADIAALKGETINNGDWEKWEKMQKEFDPEDRFVSNRQLADRDPRPGLGEIMYGPDPRIKPKPIRKKSK